MKLHALKMLFDALLIVAFLVLAGDLALEFQWPREEAADGGADAIPAQTMPVPSQPKVLAVMIPDVRTPEPLASFRRIVNRPLFTETRRPPLPKPRVIPQQVAAPAPIKPAIKSGQFRLVGVMIEDDDSHVALLRDLASKELVRVRKGEIVSGWTVDVIEARSVSLRQDDVVDTVLLRENLITDAERQSLERAAGLVPDAGKVPAAPAAPVRNFDRGPSRTGAVAKSPVPAPSPGATSRVPSTRLKSQVR